MKDRKTTLSTRDFLKILVATGGGTLLAACNIEKALTPSAIPTEPEKRKSDNETQTPTTEVATNPVPTETKEVIPPTMEYNFKLGSFDTSTTPFTLDFSEELNKTMNYVEKANKGLEATVPLPINLNMFGNYEQYKTFEEAAKDGSKGDPYFVITTDQPNHVFLYFHSIISAGDVARAIDSFIKKHPERKNEVIGKHVYINPQDSKQIDTEIAHVDVFDAEFVDNLSDGSPWGVYDTFDGALFARTDIFRIPEEIRKDRTNGTYYLTVMSCQSEDGSISLWRSSNSKQRALVTLKFKLP